jgi:hypothetical protein
VCDIGALGEPNVSIVGGQIVAGEQQRKAFGTSCHKNGETMVTRTLRIAGVIFWVTAGTIGCTDLGESPPPMYATADAQHLYLTNTTDDILYYFVAPTQWLGFIDWVPNYDPDATNRVFPGKTKSLSLEDFFWVREGYRSADLTIVWWNLVRQPDGTYAPGKLQWFEVRISLDVYN